MDIQILLGSLLRTTLFLTASGIACWLVLRKTGDRMPRLSRVLWLAVLLTGWFWIRPVLSIPLPHLAGTPAPQIVTNTIEPPVVPLERMPEPMRFAEISGDLHPRLVEVEPVSVASAFEWKPLIFKTVLTVWLGGMVVSIFLSAAGYAQFLLLLRKTVPASDDFAGPWRRLLEEHGIDARSVPMFVSDGRHDLGPALVRTVFGYRLVVPRDLWSELSESGRCGILKHEREHFRRRDVWKSFFVRILTLPHWFNPVAHLALHRFEEAAELLCDRAAFECRQEGVLEFAKTLLLLHENAPTQFVARQSIFGRGLKHRVACLLHENHDERVSVMKKIMLITGAVFILAACLFRVEFVEKTVAETSPKEPGTERSAVPGQVELRLKVVGYENNEEKDPLPNVEIALQYGFNDQYLHRWKTGSDGVGVTKIPLAAANPENQIYLRGTEKDMTQGASLYDIPKDWDPSKPLSMTIPIHRKPRRFTGTVVDFAGKPVKGAVVGSGFDHFMQWTETDEKGAFEYFYMDAPIESLFAIKDGVGAAVISPDYDKPEDNWKAMNPEGQEEWKKQKKHNNGPFTLKLEKGRPITARVVNPEGNPIEGISVAPTRFSTDYRYTKETWSWNAWNVARFWCKKTDADGMVRFDSIPTEGYDIICFDAWGTDPRFEKEKNTSRYGKGDAVWRSREKNNDLVISMRRQVMLEGSVRNADGSPPPVAMQISFTGKKWMNCGINTDYAGNFTFFVNADEIVSANPISSHRRNPGVGVAKALLNVDVGDGSKPAPRFDFVLDKGTKVVGNIIAGKPEKPFEKMYVQIYDVGFDRKTELTDMNRLFAVIEVNEKGEYETRLADGVYRFKVDKSDIPGTLEIKGEVEKRFDLKF